MHDIGGPDGVSGFGFELTFRLKREPEEASPPTWPATLMQSLAKYVFQSGKVCCTLLSITSKNSSIFIPQVTISVLVITFPGTAP